MQEFDVICLYLDEEIGLVIQCLVNDQEFLDMVGCFKLLILVCWVLVMLRVFIWCWLVNYFGNYYRVDDLQVCLFFYVGELVDDIILWVIVSGLENLDKNSVYLFIFNYCDIVFDFMVVNYFLFQNGFYIMWIVIGDNLFVNCVFVEMMCLNKSFVVCCNMISFWEMCDVYFMLFGFINYSIDINNSIWIVQWEGCVKDGLDYIDLVIIKMFYMS